MSAQGCGDPAKAALSAEPQQGSSSAIQFRCSLMTCWSRWGGSVDVGERDLDASAADVR